MTGDPLSSRALIGCVAALLVLNILLVICPTGRSFIPSDLVIGLGFGYGLLCAAYHVHMVRLAWQREPPKKTRGGQLVVVAILQAFVGMTGVAEGVGSLYTLARGSSAEVTYELADVRRAHRGHCSKHKFLDVSILRNMYGGPCRDKPAPLDSRFHYRGRASPLGFYEDDLVIEPGKVGS
jgi:hypothetical protein